MNKRPAGLDVERLERIARSALAAPPQIGRIAETLEPDPVYVAAREVVAAYQRRPYCGTDTSRAIKELDAALANTKESDGG